MECYEAQYKRPHSGWCSAANCLNQRGTSSGISFFMFPASPERCKTWAINAGRPDLEKRATSDTKTLRKNNALCEEHFHKDQFMCPEEKGVRNKRKRLMPKAIPSLFDIDATKVATWNPTIIKEPNAFRKENRKSSIGDKLIEDIVVPDCDTATDPNILLSDLVEKHDTHEYPDSGSYGVMKVVDDSGDTYLAVSLHTDGSNPSNKSILNDIVARDCLECLEPLHSDHEVAKLKHLVRKKVQCIQRLKSKVQLLETIKKNYEKPDGIIKLASSYLEPEDLAAFASKLKKLSE